MKAKELSAHHQRLLEIKAELEARGPARIDPNRTDEARAGGDQDEQPLNEMLQTIASGRNKNDAAVLGQVHLALEKLKHRPDDFGICEDCEDAIAVARLKAMPYVALCVECQGKKDDNRGRPTRRTLTDYR